MSCLRLWSLALYALFAPLVSPTRQCTIDHIESFLAPNDQARVLLAQPLGPNGTFGELGNIGYPGNATHLPPLCVTIVNVTSSPTSSYKFGLFLPVEWNHRLLAVGNGGFSGGINWPDMGPGAKYGFATLSTSTGHNSNFQDMSWALNNPESKADWAGRSLHGSTVLSKKIMGKFYETFAFKSYYSGCSTGGRQGIKSAQAHPEDFDGILAGAPAWMSTSQQLWQLKVGAINLPIDGPGYLPSSIFQTISDEVLQQCDSSDGVMDRIIMDPNRCNFQPERLLCTAERPSSCLTEPQLSTLKQLYLPLIQLDADVHNLTYLYPNFGLGSGIQMPSSFGSGNEPSLYGTDYAKYFLYDDPNWDWRKSFDYSTFTDALRLNPGDVNADDFNLTSFHNRGGKIIHYHGYADGLIPPGASRLLVDKTWAAMAAQGLQMDDFYSFFYVPGMMHCSGSVYNAPWFFGASGHASVWEPTGNMSPGPGFNDTLHDALLALVSWVEGGSSVNKLVTTKFNGDTVRGGVLRQRPICKYPGYASWDGEGNVNAASSWKCVGYSNQA